MNQPVENPTGSGQVTNVPVSQVRDSSFPVRSKLGNLIQLIVTIQTQGLLQPITVREIAPGVYEVLAGGRRLEAYRYLLSVAQTDEERRRYSTIPAQVIPNVSDARAALWSITENVHRLDLNPVELGDALSRYKDIAGIESVDKLAEVVGISERRVQRLLRLHTAPDFIKKACTEGAAAFNVESSLEEHERDEYTHHEHDRLGLIAALEFLHAYEALQGHTTDPEEMVWDLIEKALKEGWSFRKIRRECGKLTGPRKAADRGREVEDAEEGAGDPQVGEAGAVSAPAAVSPAEVRDGPGAIPAGASAAAPVAGTAPARVPSKNQNPAWEYLDEDLQDVVFHRQRFKDLNPQFRYGTRLLLRQLEDELGPQEPGFKPPPIEPAK